MPLNYQILLLIISTVGFISEKNEKTVKGCQEKFLNIKVGL